MRLLRLAILLCAISTLTFAQRGGMRGGAGGFARGGSFHSGFVGGGFRGGFVRPAFRGNVGFNHPFFFPHNRFFVPRNRFFVGVGFGLPFPYYGYPYSYGYPYYPYVDGGYPTYPVAQSGYDQGPSGQGVNYQSDPAPPVAAYEPRQTVIPEIQENPYASSQANDTPIYLIAFKNQDNIRAAEAYWVTGGTLHYVTLQNGQRLAPLNSVDRTLTDRLNRERNVDFHLPPAPASAVSQGPSKAKAKG